MRLIIMLLLVLSQLLAYGKLSNLDTSQAELILKGKVVEPSLANNPNQKFELRFYVSSLAANRLTANPPKYTVELKYNEDFEVVIPHKKGIVYLTYGCTADAANKVWTFIDKVYIVQVDGRTVIDMKIFENKIVFSGSQFHRLQCQDDVHRIEYNTTDDNDKLTKLASEGKWDSLFEFRDEKEDSILNLRLLVVKKYVKVIGRMFADTLVANCYGSRYFLQFRSMITTIYPTDAIQAFVQRTVFRNLEYSLPKFDESILVGAPIYTDFLFRMISLRNAMGDLNVGAYLQPIFNDIKLNYNGLIRDKLFALFVLNYSQVPGVLSYAKESRQLIQNASYRDLIEKAIFKLNRGQPFFPFSLEDDKGNIVTLDNLRKKVLFIDFWYTGCSNCASLKKYLEPFHKRYEKDSNVVFVTVSIDRDKQKWLKSIKSGLYTTAKSLNLLASPQATGENGRHPLINAYGITSFPTVMIVKEGQMYESAPPLFDLMKLNAVIDQAINEMMKKGLP
ncbi:TlpA family protein disulfide reductase [Chitinophaga horti]|uniref:TlpA family protein disulfide reductase n=1 Tax=Chitinophaga horti TaxID=2920382 RepID=A0ABY6IYC0_9BACT|nr:TlpA disulfide reductase family protein [Chitinophaga horti]UYQ92206.1 TlpA family protein disulfide reductase [Chitinophaga horti]